MAAIDIIRKFQSECRTMRQEEAREQGAIDTVVQQLKKEFKVATLEDAKKLLQTLDEKKKQADAAEKAALQKVEQAHAKL